MIVLYPSTDIPSGDEVLVDYLEQWDGEVDQQAVLQQRFNFTCNCASCSRTVEERNRSAERIRQYLQFVEDYPKQLPRTPSPTSLLLRLQQMTLLACNEGREHDIGPRCYDAFQLCAYYGDREAGKQWAAAYRDANILRRGSESEGAEKGALLAADPTQWRAWGQLGRRKLIGPVSCIFSVQSS